MVTTNAKPKCPRWLENREWGTRGPLWGLGAMGSREWGVGSEGKIFIRPGVRRS
jgi:hypothetical protein